MKSIDQRWKEDAGPIISGLFYAGGSYRTAILDRENTRIVFSDILQQSTDLQFADYGEYEVGSFTCSHGVLRWGGGSWEGGGWISLDDQDKNLIWLMHFEDSEPFTQARVSGDNIEAVAYEYPLMVSLTIPVLEPHLTTLTNEADTT